MKNIRVDHIGLRNFCTDVFAASIPLEEAKIVSDNLVQADLSGFYSHGVCKVTDYLNRLDEGLIEKETKLQILNETETTAVIDAHNGWGAYASKNAMELAIKKAKKYGCSFVGVRNSNHFGITSYYTKMAAEKGCVGFATTNASGLMVPFGSKEPSLGTNPVSFAVPRGGKKFPVVVDMSTGNTARGKITLANKTGGTIPENWAITKDGKTTTIPEEALEGYLLPMGPKGSGLAIMMDVLSGVLTGSLFGKHVPRMYEDKAAQNLGHMFGVIDISSFLDMEEYYEKIEDRHRQTSGSRPMEGFDKVYSPGEIEAEKINEQIKHGVKISKEILFELTQIGEKFNLNIENYISLEEI